MLVSIRAIYNWDNTIFDNFNVPSEMDKQTIIDMILHELAELTVVYSDPSTLKTYIRVWSATRVNVWDRLYALATEEYDPLDNYNRTDTITTDHGHVITMAKSLNNTKSGTSTNTGSGNVSKFTYGYNASQRAPTDDITNSDSNTVTDNLTEAEQGLDTHTNSGRDIETRHGKGNIGVTTYGKMIEEELRLRPQLDIYKYIVEEFKHEFCVMVY